MWATWSASAPCWYRHGARATQRCGGVRDREEARRHEGTLSRHHPCASRARPRRPVFSGDDPADPLARPGKDIAELGLQLADIFAKRSAINAELLKGAAFRKADITFEHDYDLDLGGVHAKLTAMGANHTAGDTIIWVAADRVLFSGDIAMRAQPAFASPHSSLKHWLASLDQLEALKPAIIVPSHGPTGDGIGFITGYRAYLTEIRDRTAAEKHAGRSVDQAIATVSAAFGDRAPDKGRLTGAIKAAYVEAP
jgi:glyoxylase-like metal-dependent hydrolase (beta-lactamase superfamily II)